MFSRIILDCIFLPNNSRPIRPKGGTSISVRVTMTITGSGSVGVVLGSVTVAVAPVSVVGLILEASCTCQFASPCRRPIRSRSAQETQEHTPSCQRICVVWFSAKCAVVFNGICCIDNLVSVNDITNSISEDVDI